MNAIKIRKTAWSQKIQDWLTAQILVGKYGFNVNTLQPDYEYFEYWFIDGEDALAFGITFSDITA